ncbi:MAG: hypothetical protein GC185_09140 [Alphaproteobacteria bacterium]|nr:hypothetical protein [Alphaproteobacteria bacterium]
MKKFQKLYDEIQQGERADIVSRLLHSVATALGSFRHRLPAAEPTVEEFMENLEPGHFESMEHFLTEHAARPAVWTEVPAEMVSPAIVTAADHAVLRHFSCLGATFHFDGDIDWHRGLNGDASWPRLHWSEVPFGRISQLGDIKPCWELNRHQFFVPLALAWRLTGDEKYVEAFTGFLNSWCDQNVPETGINYISGYEIGLRCVSWIFADRLLRGAKGYDDDTRSRLHRNLFAQARHMAEYITYKGRTGYNNLLISESAVLAYIALSCPEWEESEKWLERALGVLWPAFDDQIYPDGMHFECSFGYQLQVTECLVLLLAELRRQRRPIPAKIYTMVEKMVTVLRVARQPDGELPNINDTDGGCVVPLPLPTTGRLEGLLATMAALYDRPDFKSSTKGEFPLYAHLLLGEKGAENFRLVASYREDFPRMTHLLHSHIAMVRRDKDFLLFKNNPDPFPRSGHNHADLLSCLLFLDGRPVLCDSGTYRFADAKGYRNVLRGTSAHNTLTVDKQGQAVPKRHFDWAGPTSAGETYGQSSENAILFDGRHESYHALSVTHRRVLVWLRREEALLVIDQLDGNDTHIIDQFWHFAPGARAADSGKNSFSLTTQDDQPLAEIMFFRNDERDALEVIAASDINKNCYRSRKYGEIEPATALVHRWTATLEPGKASHRATLISKRPLAAAFTDVRHAEFRFNEWNIDLNQTPAALTRVEETGE